MSDLTTRLIRYADDGVSDPAGVASDVATAVRLMVECDIAAIGERDSGDDDLATMLAFPTLDREATCFVLDGDEPLAFVFVENDSSGGDTFVDVFCLPGPRREEAEELGVRLGLEAARRHSVAAADGVTWMARAGCWDTETGYQETLRAAGFLPSRTFYRMRIASDSAEVPREAPTLPDGVEIVARDTEEVRRRIWAVDNASFAEHYNFTPRDFDEWWTHMALRDRRPDDWWLLTVDGVDAAICLLDESRAELGDGYVGVLGVLPEFRGRGLAALLLQRAFVRYRDLGRKGTQLGVDAQNTTGAVRVYEKVGMRVTRAVQGFSQPVG